MTAETAATTRTGSGAADTTDRPQFEGVHHVLVAVPPDAKEAAHRYYEDVLGFVPVASPLESGGGSGNLWWYECGTAELHVSCVPDYRANVRPHVAISITDLPKFRERLARHGIETTLNYSYVGSWRIYVVDPWNNRLEFISQLPPGVTPGMSAKEAAAVMGRGTGAGTS